MKIKFTLETGFAGADHVDEIEVDEEELKAYKDLEEYCAEYIADMIRNYISGSWEVVED